MLSVLYHIFWSVVSITLFASLPLVMRFALPDPLGPARHDMSSRSW